MNQKSNKNDVPARLIAALAILAALVVCVALAPAAVTGQDDSLCDVVDGVTLEALIDEGVCPSIGVPVIESVEANASGEIEATWTPGFNAAGNLLLLFRADSWEDDYEVVDKDAEDTTHTFTDVSSGDYVLVVVSYNADVDFEYVYTSVTVPAN